MRDRAAPHLDYVTRAQDRSSHPPGLHPPDGVDYAPSPVTEHDVNIEVEAEGVDLAAGGEYQSLVRSQSSDVMQSSRPCSPRAGPTDLRGNNDSTDKDALGHVK